jgi:NRPS condensation-like uncharacterized protein
VKPSRRLGTSEHLWLRMGQLAANNFVMVAQLKGHICEVTLKQSLQAIVESQVMLRSRVLFTKKKRDLSIEESLDVDLRILARKDDSQWQLVAEDEMNEMIPVDHFPLWRFIWLKGESQHEFILTFNHMIADGRSGVNFFESLLARMDNSKFKIPESSLFPPCEDQFTKMGLLSSLKEYTRAFVDYRKSNREKWLQFSRTQLAQGKGATAIISRTLSGPDLKQLVETCRQQKTTVTAYLSAQMVRFLSETSQESIGVSVAVDLRPFLDEDHFKDIGYFVTSVDLAKKADFTGDIWELAEQFKLTMNQKCHRSHFKFDQLIRALAIKFKKGDEGFKKLIQDAVNNSMLLTNLGRLELKTEYDEFSLTHCFHLPTVHLMGKPFLCLATATLNDQMVLNFSYTKDLLDKQQVEKWADSLLTSLTCLE